ncbi:hypothetical protein B0A48_03314 [Cryoendolithus antarcticus]|uniref:IgE-binding protein n=1 Tax=Cryoendolithus antarcticus TaxID=1507870 RepID=A0A1V8TJN7_9PEZI|nr:hypothetical protein B0A48_03314 [Cryoendolithus antarcticus]
MKPSNLTTFLVSTALTQAQYFTLVSVRSASPIHFGQITASGERLYINRNTASYCPTQVGDACPAGNITTFAGGSGPLAMGVIVPGGQQVYIDPVCGAVGYTQAHSAAMPQGAITGGWNVSLGDPYGYLSRDGGLLACPAADGDGGYQIFGQVEGVVLSEECLGFTAFAINATGPGAWQYT